MRGPARTTTLVALSACLLLACGKGEATKEDTPAVEQTIPDKPFNGSPVAATFEGFVGKGEGRGVELHLYNFGDQRADSFVVVLRYYDDKDTLLRVKPGTPFESDSDFTSLSGNSYACDPKAHNTIELDGRLFSVPTEAARAEALVTRVSQIVNGEAPKELFSQDSWQDWPATDG